jgi:hypothetical protein
MNEARREAAWQKYENSWHGVGVEIRKMRSFIKGAHSEGYDAGYADAMKELKDLSGLSEAVLKRSVGMPKKPEYQLAKQVLDATKELKAKSRNRQDLLCNDIDCLATYPHGRH